MGKTFENQNQRAKIRLEMPDGVLLEVPLAVVVRAVQEAYMAEDEQGNRPRTKHWGFPDFFSDEPKEMVHLVVTRESRDIAIGGRQLLPRTPEKTDP